MPPLVQLASMLIAVPEGFPSLGIRTGRRTVEALSCRVEFEVLDGPSLRLPAERATYGGCKPEPQKIPPMANGFRRQSLDGSES
jgi:hypothetical protein